MKEIYLPKCETNKTKDDVGDVRYVNGARKIRGEKHHIVLL